MTGPMLNRCNASFFVSSDGVNCTLPACNTPSGSDHHPRSPVFSLPGHHQNIALLPPDGSYARVKQKARTLLMHFTWLPDVAKVTTSLLYPSGMRKDVSPSIDSSALVALMQPVNAYFGWLGGMEAFHKTAGLMLGFHGIACTLKVILE